MQRPSYDSATSQMVKLQLINPGLITNKSMWPYLHIIILFISKGPLLCKQKAMNHLPCDLAAIKCTDYDVNVTHTTLYFDFLTHTCCCTLILIMHPQVFDQSEPRIVQLCPIGEQCSPTLFMHLHAVTTHQI